MEPEIKVGTFTSAGTPAAVNLNIGFIPDRLEIIIGADINPDIFIYDKNMGDAKTIKMTGSTGVYTYETSNPIVSYDTGSISTAIVMGATATKDVGFKGVTIPAALQTASKVNYWKAMRQGA